MGVQATRIKCSFHVTSYNIKIFAIGSSPEKQKKNLKCGCHVDGFVLKSSRKKAAEFDVYAKNVSSWTFFRLYASVTEVQSKYDLFIHKVTKMFFVSMGFSSSTLMENQIKQIDFLLHFTFTQFFPNENNSWVGPLENRKNWKCVCNWNTEALIQNVYVLSLELTFRMTCTAEAIFAWEITFSACQYQFFYTTTKLKIPWKQ